MDEASAQRAIAALRVANKHLLSAWKHLVGQRVPMVGRHRDLDKALADLRVVSASAGEAIELIEKGSAAGE
jgi:hypothetical protein